MNITIDIGNTYIKLCVFQGDNIVFEDSQIQYNRDYIGNITKEYNIKNAIISSVRNNNDEIETYIKDIGVNCLTLSSYDFLPIQIAYETPTTLGQDRVAAAIGAVSIAENQNLIVIDIGTCITYDFIDKNKTFIGGNIAPGHKMRLDAMHYFTKKLPQIDASNEYIAPIGKNTTNAIKAGAYYGVLHEVKGIIKNTEQRLDTDFKTVITGGGSKDFIKDFDFEYIIEPNLVHIGLNKILEYIDENKH